MPRFRFHQQDGRRYPDEQSVDLPDLDAARGTALRAMAELVVAHSEDFWANGDWQMTVTDDEGLTLFCLFLSAVEGPACGRAPPAPPRGGKGR